MSFCINQTKNEFPTILREKSISRYDFVKFGIQILDAQNTLDNQSKDLRCHSHGIQPKHAFSYENFDIIYAKIMILT